MNLIERVKNILARPAQEWPIIDKEPTTITELYTSYIMPLAAIGPVASFVGLAVVGINVPQVGTYRVPLTNAIGHAIVSYVLALVAVYVVALIIDALAPTFNGAKSNIQAVKVAAYSSTAAWLCGVFNLLPAIGFLQILSLYSLYLLYLGLPVVMKAPQEKALIYAVSVIIAALIVLTLIGAISGMLISYPAPVPGPGP